jgi:hypothetical protein
VPVHVSSRAGSSSHFPMLEVGNFGSGEPAMSIPLVWANLVPALVLVACNGLLPDAIAVWLQINSAVERTQRNHSDAGGLGRECDLTLSLRVCLWPPQL